MTKKFIIPIACGIISSLFIGPIGLFIGFKASTIVLSSSLSFSVITGIGIYSQNSKYQEMLDRKWKNEYNKLILPKNNIFSEQENNIEFFSDTFFHFFLLQNKNKSLLKTDPDIIINAKLYFKYMNISTKNKIRKKVEILVFKNIYNIVHLSIENLCKDENDKYNKNIKKLKIKIENDKEFNKFKKTYNSHKDFFSLIFNNIKNDITISEKIDSIFKIFNKISEIFPNIIADELIQFISFILIDCEIENILTEIEFINFFYNESSHNKIGIEEYSFITLISSIENIMKLYDIDSL